MAYVGCIAGAIFLEEYQAWLREAGFRSVQVIDTGRDLNAYAQIEGQSGCCSPAESCCAEPVNVQQSLGVLLLRYDVNEYAAAVQVYAVK